MAALEKEQVGRGADNVGLEAGKINKQFLWRCYIHRDAFSSSWTYGDVVIHNTYKAQRVDSKDGAPTFNCQVCTTSHRASIVADLTRVNSTLIGGH